MKHVHHLPERAREAVRSPVPVSVFGGSREPRELARYAELGVRRVFSFLPSAGRDGRLPRLDRLARVSTSEA